MEWVPIASVPQQIGEMFQDLLWKEGIVSRLETVSPGSFLGVSPYPCRVLVRSEQADFAAAYLREVTGQTFDDESPEGGAGDA